MFKLESISQFLILVFKVLCIESGNPIAVLTLVLGMTKGYDEGVVHGELNGKLFRMTLPKLRYNLQKNHCILYGF
jgi:hypothetical protein